MQVPYEAGEASGDFLLARASAGGTIDRGPQPGSTKVNAKDGQRYVWIPPGSFIMGCSPGDTECYDNEKPAHNVSITKGFWLGQTPVTQGAYQRVVGKNPSNFKGDNLPVEQVTWDEAKLRNLIFIGSPAENSSVRLPDDFSMVTAPGYSGFVNRHP